MIASLLGTPGTVAAASDRLSAPLVGAGSASGSGAAKVEGDSAATALVSAPMWVRHVPQPAENECDALIDVSRSISPADKNAAVRRLVEMLPNILEAFNCAVIRVSAFSADAPFQPIREFVLPLLPTASSCPANREALGGIAGLARQMYPDLKAAERQKTDEACRQRQRADVAAAAGPRELAVHAAAEGALVLLQTQPHGSCTALYQAAARALQRSQRVVAVTDGAQTCHWYKTSSGAPLSIQVPEASSLQFMLVPSIGDGDAAADRIADRASQLQSVFLGADVQLLNEATPTFWLNVLKRTRSK